MATGIDVKYNNGLELILVAKELGVNTLNFQYEDYLGAGFSDKFSAHFSVSNQYYHYDVSYGPKAGEEIDKMRRLAKLLGINIK